MIREGLQDKVGAETGSWVKRLSTGAAGSTRLFCFPYAGGGPSVFRDWPRRLPPTTDLHAIHLPGRESRVVETPITALDPLVEELTPALAEVLVGPRYVFFGHSMGALVAFSVCRELRRTGTPLPDKLIVSGLGAPHLPSRHPPIHDLPEPEFIDELRRLEGTPEEALENAELMEILSPMLRADCSVSETYVLKDEPPLDCPIVALGGRDDEDVPVEDVRAWRSHTSAAFTYKIFPGGHFFVRTHQREVVSEVANHLGRP